MARISIPGISIKGPAATQSEFSSVVYDGLVIPPDSILFYESGQHTGLDGATNLTDISLNLVALSRNGFKLRNTSDNSEGIVVFNSANEMITDSRTFGSSSFKASIKDSTTRVSGSMPKALAAFFRTSDEFSYILE